MSSTSAASTRSAARRPTRTDAASVFPTGSVPSVASWLVGPPAHPTTCSPHDVLTRRALPQWLVDTVLEHPNRLPTCPLCKSIALPRLHRPAAIGGPGRARAGAASSAGATGASGTNVQAVELRVHLSERERAAQLFGRPAGPSDTFVQSLFGAAAVPPRFSERAPPQPTSSARSTADRTWPDVAD